MGIIYHLNQFLTFCHDKKPGGPNRSQWKGKGKRKGKEIKKGGKCEGQVDRIFARQFENE